MKHHLLAILLGFIVMAGVGCGTLAPSKPQYAMTASPEMVQEFEAAEQLYERRHYSRALDSYAQYIQNYPYNRLTDRARLRVGQIHLRQGNPQAALGPLDSASRGPFDSELSPDVQYALVLAYHRLDRDADAWKVLQKVAWTATRVHRRIYLAGLGVEVGQSLNRSAEELAPLYLEILDGYILLTEPLEARPPWLLGEAEVTTWVERWVDASAGDLTRLSKMRDRFSGRSSGGYVLYKLGKTAYEVGKADLAREALTNYVQGYPKHTYIQNARIWLTELGRKIDTDYTAVGVLLPLTGRYGPYGRAVLRGIECSAGILRPCQSNKVIRLIIRDSAGDPSQAQLAYQQILAAEPVAAVIGPLAQVEVDAVTRQAQLHQVTTLAMSQKEGVAEVGPYVFRNFLTIADQVHTVTRHLCATEAKSVAMLYPETVVGQTYKRIFEQDMAACGRDVTHIQSYDPQKQNYQEAIRNLKFSTAELKLGEKLGFDVLFIPDSYKNLSRIFPLLDFLNVRDVQLLGTVGWNNPKLVEEFPEVMESSVFVGAFFAESAAGPTRRFADRYRDAYDAEPSFLEAFGYDSLELVKKGARGQRNPAREDMREGLGSIRDFPAATGAITMNRFGDAKRNLFLLTVQDGKIREYP